MFTLAYIVLNENLNARVFGVSLGIVAAISGGVGSDGFAGGTPTEALGFRSIFVVVLVVAAIAAVCILKVVPQGRPQGVSGSMDWSGAGSLSVFLIFLTYFVSQRSGGMDTSPISLALLVGTVVTFAAFWAIEKRRRHPLSPSTTCVPGSSGLLSLPACSPSPACSPCLISPWWFLARTSNMASDEIPPLRPCCSWPRQLCSAFALPPWPVGSPTAAGCPLPARGRLQVGLRHCRSGFLRQSLCDYFRCCPPLAFPTQAFSLEVLTGSLSCCPPGRPPRHCPALMVPVSALAPVRRRACATIRRPGGFRRLCSRVMGFRRHCSRSLPRLLLGGGTQRRKALRP